MHVAPHELLTIVPRLAKVSVWLHSPFLSMPYIRTHKAVASIYNGRMVQDRKEVPCFCMAP